MTQPIRTLYAARNGKSRRLWLERIQCAIGWHCYEEITRGRLYCMRCPKEKAL